MFVEHESTVANGWHPWYEIKMDPEERTNLIICGSRWDSGHNALSGFVYASSDGGKTWTLAMEDKSSSWVSEHSCAFGPKHVAYFVSEASDVSDGLPNHRRGTTRLFVSSDAGRKWAEANSTGWADWSASAVKFTDPDLITFYNYTGAAVAGGIPKSGVGVLVFSPDLKSVAGPFTNPEVERLNYQGAYPSDAVSLDDGTVAALYYGRRSTPAGRAFDLNLVRFNMGSSRVPTLVRLASSDDSFGEGCFSALGQYGMAFDAKRHQIVVTYVEGSGSKCGLVFARSEDGGKTWTKNPVPTSPNATGPVAWPSIAADSSGEIGILWRSGERWFFIRSVGGSFSEVPIELWKDREPAEAGSDALQTVAFEPRSDPRDNGLREASIAIHVRASTGHIWRAGGLVGGDDRFHAVALTTDGSSEYLRSATIEKRSSIAPLPGVEEQKKELQDVTEQSTLVYGGRQVYDPASGTLAVDLQLVNRGREPICGRIRVVVDALDSGIGQIAILNADNHLPGGGAMWDLSRFMTGDRLPTGAVMFNTLRVLFRLSPASTGLSTGEWVRLKARVMGQKPCPAVGPEK